MGPDSMSFPDRMQRSKQTPKASEQVSHPAPVERPAAVPADRGLSTDAAAEPSDHECVRRAQGGDERAFELLVRRHQARALRVARNLVADPDEAADLAQEAFLRVFRSLDRFDFEHGFATWLNDGACKRNGLGFVGPGTTSAILVDGIRLRIRMPRSETRAGGRP